MKPAPFAYAAPKSVEEAAALLAAHGGDARLLAGGQSLVPMLNFRLLEPALLIDINRIAGLDGIAEIAGGLRLGALVRHRALETSPLVARRFPIIASAMAEVAHLAIRNRGTIGGSLAHSDPAAELPLLLVTLGGSVQARSVRGERTIAADDLFDGFLMTTLEHDELLTSAHFPALEPGTGWSFQEFSRRSGDFGIVSAAVTLRVSDGVCSDARIGLGGVAGTPVRLRETESALIGARLDAASMDEAARAAAAILDPPNDLHGTSAYRRHLATTLLKRGLSEALERVGTGS
ncbi:MAG TPA: xanthine dehydrogenase family protein subunit M [Stellaceae bacterium]|nr:xanthine dehydrogenase family protein subunit M [Stellaceae bacterium]